MFSELLPLITDEHHKIECEVLAAVEALKSINADAFEAILNCDRFGIDRKVAALCALIDVDTKLITPYLPSRETGFGLSAGLSCGRLRYWYRKLDFSGVEKYIANLVANGDEHFRLKAVPPDSDKYRYGFIMRGLDLLQNGMPIDCRFLGTDGSRCHTAVLAPTRIPDPNAKCVLIGRAPNDHRDCPYRDRHR